MGKKTSEKRTPAPGFGTVRLRKINKLWYARWTLNGKRHLESLKVTNQRAAEKKAKEISDLLEQGEYTKLRRRREAMSQHKTFGDVVDDFIEKGYPLTQRQAKRQGRRFWAESTIRQSKSTVNLLVKEFGDFSIRELDAETIEAYLSRLRDRGLSVGSRNRHLAILKVISSKAHEWGLTDRDSAAEVGTEKMADKTPRPYRQAELDALLPSLEERHRDIAVAYMETGLRRSEMMHLIWADVDLDGRELTVRQTKNGDDRSIPMSPAVHEILAQHREKWEKERRETMDPHVYGSNADIRQVLDRAMTRINRENPALFDPERRSQIRPLHSLRDNFITSLAGQGIPLDRRMKLSGHRDAKMNLCYGEVEPDALKDAIAVTFDRKAGT